jgi:dTDP-4-dehydrorhamnose 3,5-epimerase
MTELCDSLQQTGFAGLFLYQGKRVADARGEFRKFLDLSVIAQVQDAPMECYVSSSAKHVVRGLHFQRAPHAQYKLVACLSGAFLDVAVDLRPGSATYGQTFSAEISCENNKVICVPPLFAHGIVSLEDNTTMLSMSSIGYFPEYEDGIRMDSLGLPFDFGAFTFTPKDRGLRTLAQYLEQARAN